MNFIQTEVKIFSLERHNNLESIETKKEEAHLKEMYV